MEVVKFNREFHGGTINHRMARASVIAANSEAHQRHGALLMQGGRTLAIGINSDKNPSYLDGIHPNYSSVHAEVAATKLHATVPNTTLYLVRLGRNGKLADSTPCPRCVEWLLWSTSVKLVLHS